MSQIERSVGAAQRRLFLNRWLSCLAWTTTSVAGAFAALLLFVRLYDWPVPVAWTALAAAALAVVIASVWALVGRPDAITAAAALDSAAGLRERISSGLLCRSDADPFAQAVVEDAESISRSITVRQHLRLKVPSAAGYALVTAVIALAMLLVPRGWLKSEEVIQNEQKNLAAERTRAVVQKQLESVTKLAERNPGLKELKEDLERLDKMPEGKLEKPNDIRHEAVKKIDKLTDAIKERRESAPMQESEEFRKMMRRMKAPENADTTAGKLQKSLAQGDFKTAHEEVQNLKEQLATLQQEQDPEQIKNLQKQLDELAKQLEKAAENKQLAEKLEQAGIKKEDLERMLKNLSKQDLEQVKKQLEQQGMNQKQIEQMAKQLQQQCSAGSKAQKMSQAMKNAASAAGQGQMGEAMSQLQQAGDQLSEAESLEQEKNQLDSAMSDLQDAKNDLNDGCKQCNGTGKCGSGNCPTCSGSGQQPGEGQKGAGMGKLGQGRGGLAPEEKTDVAFKTERVKVHTGKGKIIGQFLVDGEQVKGQVSKEMSRIVSAAERDATDAINRDRIPRQYQKSVKEYFSSVSDLLNGPATAGKPPSGTEDPAESDEDEAPADEEPSGEESTESP